MNQSPDEWQSAQQQQPSKKPAMSTGVLVGLVGAGLLAISTLVVGVSVLRHSPAPTALVQPAMTAPERPLAPVPTAAVTSVPDPAKALAQRILSTPNAVEAAKLCQLTDDRDKIGAGTLLFSSWANLKMTWDEVSGESTTSFGRIMKDPGAERGKRGCWSGSVFEIHSSKNDSGETLYVGGLINQSVHPVRFVAVHSSGAIVEGSAARICGIVVGTFDYGNSGGGVTHAIQIVGMFDLPENRTFGAAKPSSTGTTLDLTH